MLARLEAAYLSLLRVVILVAATLALVVAAFAIATSAPFFLSQTGFGQSVKGGALSEFVNEQRALGEDITAPSDTTTLDTRQHVSPSLLASAKRLADYANKHHSAGLRTEEVGDALANTQAEFPISYQADYEKSLDELTGQLATSTGKPLSLDKIGALLDWHDQRFRNMVAEREAEQSQSMVSAITAFGTAGGAILIFVFLVFCFLFVRIERNLRVVRVVSADPDTTN